MAERQADPARKAEEFFLGFPFTSSSLLPKTAFAAKTPEARSLQRHFGELVTLIQDPALLTAELYSREIVSSQLLERTNNPTLAREFKNIAILSAVIGYLEVHPEEFGEIVRVLKGDLTLAPLATRVTKTYETLAMYQQDEQFQGKPLSHLPPAIARYAKYLKLQYNLPAIEKWPPSPLKKTIDQILIEKTEELACLRSASSMSGTTNDIIMQEQKAVYLYLSEISDNKPVPKCILVEGGPGTGKSTLAWAACKGWASGELFTEYDLVVLLKMREKSLREISEVCELFSHDDPTLQNEVAREVIEREGKGVLFLFEVLDELPPSKLSEDSVFMKLLTGRTLPAATVLITSRPWATKPLLEQCRGVVSRRLELFGFTKENISQYITEAFPDEQERAKFKMYLTKQPYIETLMSVPLNCAIVVQLYKSYQGTPNVPKTMTQLYSSLVLSLLQRYAKEQPQYKERHIRDLTHLPSPICEQFHAVCKLAFTGLTQPSAEVIFTDDELPVDFSSLGLMQTTTQIHPDVGTRVSYHFLHITVQEFLAAFHLALEDEQIQIDFLLQNILVYKLDIMFAFLLGLSKPSLALWNSLLLALHWESAEVLDLSSSECIVYLHWLYESQNLDACTAFLSTRYIKYNLPSKLPPFYFYTLGYCIFHSNCSWEIDLSLARPDLTPALMFSRALSESSSYTTDETVSFTGSIRSLCAVLDSFGDEALLSMLSAHPRILRALSVLNLMCNKRISSVSCKALAQSLSKGLLPNLESLLFGGSSIGKGGTAELLGALACSTSIRELDLANTGMGLEDIEELGKLIMISHSLQKLKIENNPLDSESLQLIASVLPVNKSLQQLNMSGICFTTEDVAHLALGLQENHSLEVLLLRRCSINSTGAIHLAAALKENKILKALDMPANSIGEKGAKAFADMLHNNQTIKRLDLTDNSIRIKGAIKLITTLEFNTTLNAMYLDKSCAPPELHLVSSVTVIRRCHFH